MTVELRPAWCLTDEIVSEGLVLGSWIDGHGHDAFARDGDDWHPGELITLQRTIQLATDLGALRRLFGLRAGTGIGVAARWVCRATSTAGVHAGGPEPITLTEDLELAIQLPAVLAGSIEIETCLLVTSAGGERISATIPSGALIWSDGWSIQKAARTVLLEGDHARIPVRTVRFAQYFGEPSGALWAIDIDPSVALDDLVSNAVTVLLNGEVLERDFSRSGEPDAAELPASALAGIQVDLVRSLVAALIDDLPAANEKEMQLGSVGAMLLQRLVETFGSLDGGLKNFIHDQPVFARELWHRFAPDSWRGRP